MDDDELSLGDLGIANPERPLPRREPFAVDMNRDAVEARKAERFARPAASGFPMPKMIPIPEPVPTPPPFERVPVLDVLDVPPEAPSYFWDGLLPAGHVTMLGAHGGTWKSMVALMLAYALPTGAPLFGVATRPARVVFYSAEDTAGLVRYRLHLIAKGMGLHPDALAQLLDRLHILDATVSDPVLYREVMAAGTRHGVTTAAYAALHNYIEQHDIDVVIIDNASDAFDANENDRSRVRGFMRALSMLAQPDRAVLLLAHVDKGTSRGDRSGSEGYSGSTAWHNSARSRLFMSRGSDGAVTLEQQKLNLGRMREPLRLLWPDGGIPTLDQPVQGFVQHIADGNDLKALLKLLHEFYSRGEFVSPSQNSPSNAARILAAERSFPKRKPHEVFGLLRDAERRGLIERQTYRNGDRKERERWALTVSGSGLIGAPAPSAPSAPSPEDGTPSAASAGSAPSAPTPGAGGVGGGARAQVGGAGHQ